MELALHLGMTADGLTQSMTAAELDRWAKYALQKPLPYKRMELMLAQVCLIIARTMGGAKDVKLMDFMLSTPEERPNNVTSIEAARAAFGFKPRKPKA